MKPETFALKKIFNLLTSQHFTSILLYMLRVKTHIEEKIITSTLANNLTSHGGKNN